MSHLRGYDVRLRCARIGNGSSYPPLRIRSTAAPNERLWYIMTPVRGKATLAAPLPLASRFIIRGFGMVDRTEATTEWQVGLSDRSECSRQSAIREGA